VPLSRANPRLKHLRRLVERRATRDEEQRYVLEGPTLVGEALAAGVPVEQIFYEGDEFGAVVDRAREAGVAVDEVDEGALAAVLDTVTPRPIAAIAPQPRSDLETVLDDDTGRVDTGLSDRAGGPIVVLAGVSDPGNAGALVRTAEAAGARAVVFADQSVDPFSPKVVRASAGAVARLPVVSGVAGVEVLQRLGAADVLRLGADRAGGRAPENFDLTRPVAFVLGNEAHGLDDELDGWLDERITIPLAPPVESLNVAMAGSVLLFEAQRQRRTAERATIASEIVSHVSHEIRSPLTAVKGFSSVLVSRWDRLDDDKKKAMLGDINREADRVSRLLAELLDMSRIESGRLRLEHRYVVPSGLAQAALDRVLVDHPDLECRLDVADDLPRAVGDPDRLERILVNLLENAAKYGEGVEVAVEGASSTEPDGAVLVLTVRDGGPGMTDDALAAAFDPTRRGEGGRPSGSGMGLWLSRSVLRAHGGDLRVESRPGEGTRAAMVIPAQESDR
jgi:signal transduction histidine kinase